MKQALGYIRVSSEEQADSGLGMAAQLERIELHCRAKGVELVEVFVDAGVSAGKPLATRPEGSRLLAEAKRSKRAIVIAKLDRAFRSVSDATTTINSLDKVGVAIVSLAEGFDTTDSNPFARAMLQMVAIFGELERSLIRQRTKDALGVKRTRGERISRHAPFGWDFAADGAMVQNAAEQDVIRTIQALRAEGNTFQAIAAILNARGILAKQGGSWGHTSVRAILKRNAA
jgi:site-specific DNA recombinase